MGLGPKMPVSYFKRILMCITLWLKAIGQGIYKIVSLSPADTRQVLRDRKKTWSQLQSFDFRRGQLQILCRFLEIPWLPQQWGWDRHKATQTMGSGK